MRHIRKISLYALLIISSIVTLSCSKDNGEISDNLSAPQYNLPKGESGSIDEMIYNYHQKYGTYFLFEFEQDDMYRMWDKEWVNWYKPANLTANKKYVRNILEHIESSIFKTFNTEFLKKTFPYKIFLVDTLCNGSIYSKTSIRNMLSNGHNAIAIGFVGTAQDSYTEADWRKFETDLTNLYTIFYYEGLSSKPNDFIATRYRQTTMPRVTDPLGEFVQYEFSCLSAGHIKGKNGTSYLLPIPQEDFGFFIAYFTSNSATKIKNVVNRFEIIKMRIRLLNTFMKESLDMNLTSIQNKNFPDDKLPAGFFENL